MKKITKAQIDQVCEESRESPRKRKNFNYHAELTDSLQRMLNAMQPDTYIQPHKHEDPDKREAFIILTGSVLIVTFNDYGEIKDHILLNQKKGNFGVEIPERTWHSLIILEENSVVYEVKDGPYSPISDKNFASWAPAENDPNCNEFNLNILKQLNIEPYTE